MAIVLKDPRITTFISWLSREGFGANAVWNQLPRFGFPKFHRQSFLGEYRRINNLMKLEGVTRATDPYELFPKRLMSEVPLKADVNYRTYFDVSIRDRETGKIVEVRRVSMYHDEYMSPDEWESDFLSKYREYWSAKGLEMSAIDLVNVEHFQGRPY